MQKNHVQRIIQSDDKRIVVSDDSFAVRLPLVMFFCMRYFNFDCKFYENQIFVCNNIIFFFWKDDGINDVDANLHSNALNADDTQFTICLLLCFGLICIWNMWNPHATNEYENLKKKLQQQVIFHTNRILSSQIHFVFSCVCKENK